MRAHLTSGVRLLVAQRQLYGESRVIDASAACSFFSAAFIGAQALVIFPGPALISSVVCNVVALHGSVWLSALRQPAHQGAAPKCHMPSPWRPPVLRQSAQRHQFAKAVQAIAKSPCNHGRWFTVRIQVSRSVAFPRLKSLAHIPCLRHVRHNSIQSHKGGLAHATVKHHSPSRHGRLVLLGRSLSPQPNFAVNGTPTSLLASARPCGRPLPLALGFWLHL